MNSTMRAKKEGLNRCSQLIIDSSAKRKVIQVALKTMFRLRKERPNMNLNVKIANINELKESRFKKWFEVRTIEKLEEVM